MAGNRRLRSLGACLWIFLLLGSTAPKAALTNGQFESGAFTGWYLYGFGAIAYNGSLYQPIQGDYSALLINYSTAPVPPYSCLTDIWNINCPNPIPFQPMGGIAPTFAPAPYIPNEFLRGTYIAQDVVASAGDILSFDYQFIHPDVDGVRFFATDGSAILRFEVCGYYATSCSTSFNFAFPSAGLWSIYIGTYQAEDPYIYSVLEIDNVTLRSVAEPSTFLLFLAASCCLRLSRRCAVIRVASLRRPACETALLPKGGLNV